MTPGSAVRHATDCATRPVLQGKHIVKQLYIVLVWIKINFVSGLFWVQTDCKGVCARGDRVEVPFS